MGDQTPGKVGSCAVFQTMSGVRRAIRAGFLILIVLFGEFD